MGRQVVQLLVAFCLFMEEGFGTIILYLPIYTGKDWYGVCPTSYLLHNLLDAKSFFSKFNFPSLL
jgi:hypothetical protein